MTKMGRLGHVSQHGTIHKNFESTIQDMCRNFSRFSSPVPSRWMSIKTRLQTLHTNSSHHHHYHQSQQRMYFRAEVLSNRAPCPKPPSANLLKWRRARTIYQASTEISYAPTQPCIGHLPKWNREKPAGWHKFYSRGATEKY